MIVSPFGKDSARLVMLGAVILLLQFTIKLLFFCLNGDVLGGIGFAVLLSLTVREQDQDIREGLVYA
jgi:hypothetical protein